MKRYLCSKHIHHLKNENKSVVLSQDKCSICRWEKRPLTLKDMARNLEGIAESMRIAYEDPYYDPFGITYRTIFPLMNKFLKSCHVAYRKQFVDEITEGIEYE